MRPDVSEQVCRVYAMCVHTNCAKPVSLLSSYSPELRCLYSSLTVCNEPCTDDGRGQGRDFMVRVAGTCEMLFQEAFGHGTLLVMSGVQFQSMSPKRVICFHFNGRNEYVSERLKCCYLLLFSGGV